MLRKIYEKEEQNAGISGPSHGVLKNLKGRQKNNVKFLLNLTETS